MNLYGVGGVTTGYVLPKHESPRRVETERAPVAPARWPAATAPGVLAPAGPSLQTQAPSGTDPELWGVLNAEERAFFAHVGGMGPLTYSPMIHSGAPATAVMRGGRLDVRA